MATDEREDCADVGLGRAAGPALPATTRQRLEAAMPRVGEGWAARAHGTDPTADALSVRVGVIVATAELDPASAGFADDGFRESDEELLERVMFDGAALTLARKRLRSGKDAALALIAELGLAVYDPDKPAAWLLVTGGNTSAVVVDAAGEKHNDGNPHRVGDARGGVARGCRRSTPAGTSGGVV